MHRVIDHAKVRKKEKRHLMHARTTNYMTNKWAILQSQFEDIKKLFSLDAYINASFYLKECRARKFKVYFLKYFL